MIFHNKLAEKLYFLWPDLLYSAKDGTWYAMYHNDNTILTNANRKIRAFKYKSSKDYREVRELIIKKYSLAPMKIKGH